MKVLVTGCERSGTTMMCNALNGMGGNEFKPVMAAYKSWREIRRWRKFAGHVANHDAYLDTYLKNISPDVQKHSLNMEHDHDFFVFILQFFPKVKIVYMIRDGRDVVLSMINKLWGGSEGKQMHRTIDEACDQWMHVCSMASYIGIYPIRCKYEEIDWALIEEFTGIKPNVPTLNKSNYDRKFVPIIEQKIQPSLIKMGYERT